MPTAAELLVAAVNGALALLRQPPITSLDQETHAARVMKALWLGVLDDCLADHRWNFAEHSFTPALETADADPEGFYRHPLPDHCLQVVEVAGCEAGDWKVVAPSNPDADDASQARILACKVVTPRVTATVRIVNAGLWPPKFRKTFEARLAEDAAGPIARDGAAGAELEARAKRRLTEARRRDGQEGARKEVRRDTSWIAARRRSGL